MGISVVACDPGSQGSPRLPRPNGIYDPSIWVQSNCDFQSSFPRSALFFTPKPSWKVGKPLTPPKMGPIWTEDQGMGFPERCVDCQGSASHWKLHCYIHYHTFSEKNIWKLYTKICWIVALYYASHVFYMCSLCVLYVFYMWLCAHCSTTVAGHHQVAGEDLVAEMEQKEDKGRPYHGYPLVI